MNRQDNKTYVFIDASNLFYGGEKSLGWKIDYKKLIEYLKKRYSVSKVFYFGGVELHKFPYNYLSQDTVPLNDLELYLRNYIKSQAKSLDEAKLILFSRHLKRIKFYKKLEEFGYTLFLKPVKLYFKPDGSTERKANCDVELAFYLMKEIENFSRVLILSGDGDFLPVLKYMKDLGKEVIVLARGPRTAREIRQFAGSNFRDFVRLESEIKFEEKKDK